MTYDRRIAGTVETDPLERAEEVARTLARQRRFEEAQSLREAREHLANVRRSYETLAEARNLRFAALWPQAGNGSGHSVRLNLVWNGRLREPVTLHQRTFERQIEIAMADVRDERATARANGVPGLVAVAQSELDSFLAVRRWFYEAEKVRKIVMSEAGDEWSCREAFEAELATEASYLLRA